MFNVDKTVAISLEERGKKTFKKNFRNVFVILDVIFW